MARYPELTGQAAIVTGTDSPPGDAVARELESHGLRVIRVDHSVSRDVDGNRLQHHSDEVLRVDMVGAEAVERMCAQVVGRYGRIDLLVHCAGTLPGNGGPEITDIFDDRWRRAITHTLRSSFLFAKAVLPPMLIQGRGSIIFMTAQAARRPAYAAGADYAAVRGGLIGLARHLAREVGPGGVRVNAIAPPDMAVAGGTPLPLLPGTIVCGADSSPEDFARLVAFLASDSAAYITGVCLDAFP